MTLRTGDTGAPADAAGRLRLLVVSPPVSQPAQPPAGPFTLASGLRGLGAEAGLLDLSPPFLLGLLDDDVLAPSLRYLRQGERHSGLYEPHRHRSAAGSLHAHLRRSFRDSDWRVSLMDVTPPERAHSIPHLMETARGGSTPFSGFLRSYALGRITDFSPDRVLVSVSYLSQLPAALELAFLLRQTGIPFSVGGSFPRSLATSGSGVEYLRRAIPELDLNDGSSFMGATEGSVARAPLWPLMPGGFEYMCSRPVIPLPMTIGCPWGRCLFCPDRWTPYRKAAVRGLRAFLESVPEPIRARRPLLHLADSAVPAECLGDILEPLRDAGFGFYGFVRPESGLLRDGLPNRLGDAGCMMLQLGVESGSRRLLKMHRKGVEPETSLDVLRRLADSGVRTYAYLLMGLPGESQEDRRLTLRLLEEAEGSIDFLNVSVFNMPWRAAGEMERELGTAAGSYASRDGVIELYRPFDYRGRDLRAEAREFISGPMAQLPAAAEALQRTPRWFRATHMSLMELD